MRKWLIWSPFFRGGPFQLPTLISRGTLESAPHDTRAVRSDQTADWKRLGQTWTHRVSAISLLPRFHVDMQDSRNKREMGWVRMQLWIRKICRPQLFERYSQFSTLEECAWQLKVQKMTRRGWSLFLSFRNNWRHLCRAFAIFTHSTDVKLREKASHSSRSSVFATSSKKPDCHEYLAQWDLQFHMRKFPVLVLPLLFSGTTEIYSDSTETRVECKSAQIGEGGRVSWLRFYSMNEMEFYEEIGVLADLFHLTALIEYFRKCFLFKSPSDACLPA